MTILELGISVPVVGSLCICLHETFSLFKLQKSHDLQKSLNLPFQAGTNSDHRYNNILCYIGLLSLF